MNKGKFQEGYKKLLDIMNKSTFQEGYKKLLNDNWLSRYLEINDLEQFKEPMLDLCEKEFNESVDIFTYYGLSTMDTFSILCKFSKEFSDWSEYLYSKFVTTLPSSYSNLKIKQSADSKINFYINKRAVKKEFDELTKDINQVNINNSRKVNRI